MAATTKSYFTLKEKYDRIIVLIDMDAFYCQVEEKLNPELKGKPIAVVQYTENAGIIAVNYPARALGISRHMREKEAQAACKELTLVKVASKHGKADISKYRDAGAEVARVFLKFTELLERASIDEAYLDITENVAKRIQEMRDKKFQMQAPHFVNSYAVGYNTVGNFIQDVSASVDQTFSQVDEDDRASYSSSKLRLLIGATIVSDIRRAVFEETGYTCSAGIAHNKILAKLVCGMNKPNKQTILPLNSISGLFEKLDISKIKSMGGKIGEEVRQKLNVNVVNDLLKYSESDLRQHFSERIANFLYLIARGIDLEKVRLKINSKSISVSKNFLGKSEINNINTLKYWLMQLSEEVKERLDNDAMETNRYCRQLSVQFTQFINGRNQAFTRVVQLNGNFLNDYLKEEIANVCYDTIEKNSPKFIKIEGKFLLHYGIRHLGITATKFEPRNSSAGSIQTFLNKKPQNVEVSNESNDEPGTSKDENVPESPKEVEEEEQPKIRVKSEIELKGTLKKFERDSDVLTPVACEEPMDLDAPIEEEKFEEVVSYESDEEMLEVSNETNFNTAKNFSGENAIRGLKTLKFWICELFREMDKKLLNHEEPEELEIHFTQIIKGSKVKLSESIPLFVLSGVISADFIIDTIKESSSNFMADGNAINPIVRFEFVPVKFQNETIWQLKLFEDMKNEAGQNKKNQSMDIEQIDVMENETPLAIDDESEIAEMEKSIIEYQEPEPSTSKDQSYLDSYVEMKPRITLDDLNPLEKCTQCGKIIRKFDMQTHIDGHYAMDLAQTQREEYRAEKKKVVPKKEQKKPPKKQSNGNTELTPWLTMTKQELCDKLYPPDEYVKCEECGSPILIENYDVHKDYHFAKKLRRDLWQNVLKARENKRKLAEASTSNDAGTSQKKMKSVKDFFTK